MHCVRGKCHSRKFLCFNFCQKIRKDEGKQSLTTIFWLYFQVIFREDSDSWINVSNIFHVIEQRNSAALEFIVSSEETGFRHLYHVKSALHLQGGPEEEHERLSRLRLQPQIVEKTPLTSGEWTVSHNPIGKL